MNRIVYSTLFPVIAKLAIGFAAAQPTLTPQPSAPFVAFTVEEADYTGLRTFAGKLPYDEAAPLIRWLELKEGRARAAKGRAEGAERGNADANKGTPTGDKAE